MSGFLPAFSVHFSLPMGRPVRPATNFIGFRISPHSPMSATGRWMWFEVTMELRIVNSYHFLV
jgi:hypothetical protein